MSELANDDLALQHRAAADDARCILACLGGLAVMCIEGAAISQHGVLLARLEDQVMAGIGRDIVREMACELQAARETMNALMQRLGDYYNNHDAVSKVMTDTSAPAYEALHKRARGETLDE